MLQRQPLWRVCRSLAELASQCRCNPGSLDSTPVCSATALARSSHSTWSSCEAARGFSAVPDSLQHSSLAQQACASSCSRWQNPSWVLWRSVPPGSSAFHTSSLAATEYITLNNIADNPGATHSPKRLGRGIGSGLGKTSGRGHKGQKARTGRKVKAGFEGGQTPLRLRVPKRGFHNPHRVVWEPLNLARLQQRIASGFLDPAQVITMKALRDAGAVGKRVKHGVKLLAQGANAFDIPVHIEVSQASAAARAAIERAGGSVTTVYYNALGLRALLKPEAFERKGRLIPRPARPHPKVADRFDRTGTLPPALGLPTAQPPSQVAASASS